MATKQHYQCRAVIETVGRRKHSYFRSRLFVYTEYTVLVWHSSSPQTYDFLGFVTKFHVKASIKIPDKTHDFTGGGGVQNICNNTSKI